MVGLVIAFPGMVMHYKGAGTGVDPASIQQLDLPADGGPAAARPRHPAAPCPASSRRRAPRPARAGAAAGPPGLEPPTAPLPGLEPPPQQGAPPAN